MYTDVVCFVISLFSFLFSFQSTSSHSVLFSELNIIKWTFRQTESGRQAGRQADWCWRDWISRAEFLSLSLSWYLWDACQTLEGGSIEERKKKGKKTSLCSELVSDASGCLCAPLFEWNTKRVANPELKEGWPSCVITNAIQHCSVTAATWDAGQGESEVGWAGTVNQTEMYQVRSNCCQRNALAACIHTYKDTGSHTHYAVRHVLSVSSLASEIFLCWWEPAHCWMLMSRLKYLSLILCYCVPPAAAE